MQIFSHFERDDTAHISVQLSADQYADLRRWMHTPEGSLVEFLHGVKLLQRGFGWYRMEASRPLRAVDKLKTSLAVVRKWFRDYEARRNQELRLLLTKQDGGQVQSYSSVTAAFTVRTAEGTTVVGRKDNKVLTPSGHKAADPNALARLSAKFAGARR